MWSVTGMEPLQSGQRALAIQRASLGDKALQVELNFRLGQVDHQLGQYPMAMNFLRRQNEAGGVAPR